MVEAYHAITRPDGQRRYWCRFFWEGNYHLGYLSEEDMRTRLDVSEENIQRMSKAFEEREALMGGQS